jgi:hypothetical protein
LLSWVVCMLIMCYLKSKVDSKWELVVVGLWQAQDTRHTITMFELMEFMLQFFLIKVSCNNILYITSVNPVHNAPVELPPARSFPARAPPRPSPTRASPPNPVLHRALLSPTPPKHSTGNEQWLEESSRHCSHRQTNIVTLIYKMSLCFG